jgi:ADP-ribose pyrophosphatase YjhB (NUDIX family)
MPIVSIDDFPARNLYRFCPLCATELARVTDHGVQRLRCPVCGWFHYPNAALASTVLIEHEGGIVLVRRAIPPDVGIWHLPIGHVEYGETPAEAARREATEETGLELDSPVFLDLEFSPSYSDPKLHYVVFCFCSRSCGGTLAVDHENEEVAVFPEQALPALKWTSHRRTLAAWRARREGRSWAVGQTLA